MNDIHHHAWRTMLSGRNNTRGTIWRVTGAAILLTLAALMTATVASASQSKAERPTTSGAKPLTTAVAGGITVYQAKLVGRSIALGSGGRPTTVATKAVPAGRYLVTGFIGVNAQPGSFIVCAVSNSRNGNDGVFGTYANQTAFGAQVNVSETEVVTVRARQSIHLTCDDNNGKSGDLVGEAIIEATPVNALH